MTIQAVVFDIGNVLIEWDPERFFDSEIGPDRRRAFFAAVDMSGVNERSDMGEAFHKLMAETAAAHPDWETEVNIWRDRWIDLASPAIDHSVRLMAALQARKVPVFSLSNFGVQTYDIAAAKYPFLRHFDRDFVSGHLRMMKPDPAIYQHLEQESGIAPDALLFADDRADNIVAATARGWQTHLFEHPQGWADRLVSEGLLTAEEAQ